MTAFDDLQTRRLLLLLGLALGWANGVRLLASDTNQTPTILNDFRISGGYFQFEVSTDPMASLVMEATPRLSNASWSPILVFPAPRSTNLSIVDKMSQPYQFYRTRSLRTFNNGTILEWKPIAVVESFTRGSAAIEPVFGATSGVNQKCMRPIATPACDPNRPGVREIQGGYNIRGYGADRRIYGTPADPNQRRLYYSLDEGLSWTFLHEFGTESGSRVEAVRSLVCGKTEVLFANTRTLTSGELFMSTDCGITWSQDLMPLKSAHWTAALLSLQGTMLVEQVNGRELGECRLLFAFYGARASSQDRRRGALRIYRTDKTISEMAAGQIPTLLLAWKQDCWDYWAHHVSGTTVQAGKTGVVSATATTLRDEGAPFGDTNSQQNRSVLITSGTGASQRRTIAESSATTLTIDSPWQIIPDANSSYQIDQAPPDLDGMHLHCAAWQPTAPDGANNVLYVSFGDGSSSHICRLPGFDRFATIADNADLYGQPYNYESNQVWLTNEQPTAVIVSDDKLVLLARDNPRSTLSWLSTGEPENSTTTAIAWDTFESGPATGKYFAYTYDGVAFGNTFLFSNHSAQSDGQAGVFAFTGFASQQVVRLSRRVLPPQQGFRRCYQPLNATNASMVFGNSPAVVVDVPVLRQLNSVLVVNQSTNPVPNAGFQEISGGFPARWTKISSGSAVFSVENQQQPVFGEANYLRIALTKANDIPGLKTTGCVGSIKPGDMVQASVAYRLNRGSVVAHPSIVNLYLEWHGANGAFLSQSQTFAAQDSIIDEWITLSHSAVAPTGAAQYFLKVLVTGFTGAIDLALPAASVGKGRYPVPAIGSRESDLLSYITDQSLWNGLTASRVQFWASPLWPTDIERDGYETICTIESHDGLRFRLDWSFHDGFIASLWDPAQSEKMARQGLGKLEMTRFDVADVTVEYRQGFFDVRILTPGERLAGCLASPSVGYFRPKQVQLGGDHWTPSTRGWEGYYALGELAGANLPSAAVSASSNICPFEDNP